MADNTVSILDRLAKQRIETLPDDADHYRIAEHFVEKEAVTSGVPPVSTMGRFWRFDQESSLWSSITPDAVAAAIGASYPGWKLCRRGSDYKQIASLAMQLVEDGQFFSSAPAGIAAASKFWFIDERGCISSEPLESKHRQRVRIDADPEFDGDAPKFFNLLDNAFGKGADGDAQRELMQMALGAVITGALWRLRTVLLLFGATSTGKSTVLEVLRSFFPADMIGATSPQNWASEYYVAALAGKSLNIVGELDPHTPIPGGPFKAVTGADVIEGRHPTHRPFSFVCDAAHIFNCNRLPPTRDKSDAFYRRWRVLWFRNSIRVGEEIIGLAEQIIAEERSAILGWLLEGAAKVAERGCLPETREHAHLIEFWRAANNSALQFLLDTEFCESAPAHIVKAADVFDTYRKWANAEGLKPLGRNGFYDAVEEGAARIGVRIYADSDGIKQIQGVSLRQA